MLNHHIILHLVLLKQGLRMFKVKGVKMWTLCLDKCDLSIIHYYFARRMLYIVLYTWLHYAKVNPVLA